MTSKDRATEITALLTHLAELLTDERPPEVPEPRPSPQRTLLTVDEAAQLLNIGKTKTYALVRSGELESVLIGRLRRIHINAIDKYAAHLASAQHPNGPEELGGTK